MGTAVHSTATRRKEGGVFWLGACLLVVGVSIACVVCDKALQPLRVQLSQARQTLLQATNELAHVTFQLEREQFCNERYRQALESKKRTGNFPKFRRQCTLENPGSLYWVDLNRPKSDKPIEFSADGRKIAVGANENGFRVFDAATGKLLQRIDLDQQVIALYRSPLGNRMVCQSQRRDRLQEGPWFRGDLFVFDSLTFEKIGAISDAGCDPRKALETSFSPNGKLLLRSRETNTEKEILVIDLESASIVWQIQFNKSESRFWNSCFLDDEHVCISRLLQTRASSDSVLEIWNFRRNEKTKNLSLTKMKSAGALDRTHCRGVRELLPLHSNSKCVMLCSAQTMFCASDSFQKFIVTPFNIETEEVGASFDKWGDSKVARLSKDRRTFVFYAYQGPVKVWDVQTNTCSREFSNTDSVTGILFSDFGELVAIHHRAGDIYDRGMTKVTKRIVEDFTLYDTATGRDLFARFEGVDNIPEPLLFSPDCRLLITRGYDVWDLNWSNRNDESSKLPSRLEGRVQ